MSKVLTTPTAPKGPSPDFSSPLFTPSPGSRLYINTTSVALNATSTGLDKLHLYLPPGSFDLDDYRAAGLDLDPHRIKAADLAAGVTPDTPCFIDGGGRAAIGSSLHTSDPGLPVHYRIARGGLTVQANPSRLAPTAGLNLCATDADLDRSLDLMLADAHRRGFRLDLDAGKLTRVDSTRDLHTSHPFDEYLPLLASLNFKRGGNAREYPDGVIMGNKSVQLCGYNKGLDNYNKGVSPTLDDRLLRLELRDLNNKPLKRDGLDTLRDLRAFGLGGIGERYRAALRSRVFKADTLAALTAGAAYVDDLDSALAFAEKYPRDWPLRFATARALRGETMTPARFRALIYEVTADRSTAYRQWQRAEAALAFDRARSASRYADHYRELYTAFAA